nr:YppG family protein [Bacillus licheniformis]
MSRIWTRFQSIISLFSEANALLPPFQGFPYQHPYPSPRPNLHQPSQFQSFLSQFKKKNGQIDFSKMMDTAGQMVSTVNQVGALAKGFMGFFK